MGTKGQEIVKGDVKTIVDLLNRALADEWLAYYQYWVGAKIVRGPMRGELEKELLEHADDELKHAGLVADRIIELGGTPILSPEEWYKQTNCGYETPTDESVHKILEQNIKGEQCAIDVYNKLLDEVRGKDTITFHMVVEILEDEVEHETDLEAIVDDLATLKD